MARYKRLVKEVFRNGKKTGRNDGDKRLVRKVFHNAEKDREEWHDGSA